MKNAHTGKLISHILTVLMCAVILVMIGCCFCPYFTITEAYHFILNPNPTPEHYSLVGLMWTNTKVITSYYKELYSNFNINDFVTNMVLSFIFGLGTVVACVWHFANEFRRYPTMVSGVVSNIAAICWSLFSLLAYPSNQLLDLGVAEFMGIRNVIIALIIAGTVLVVVRFVVWLLTEIKISQERKARLALL